jgi:hypothetical protein
MQQHAPNKAHNLVWTPALIARHRLTNGLRQHVYDQCLRQTFRTAYETQENLTTWWSLWKPNTKQARGNLERCSNGTASYPSPWRKLPNSVHRFDLKKPLRNLSCQSAKSLVAECRWRAKVPASHLQIVPRSLVIETSINGNFRILYMVSTPINRFLTWPLILGRSKRYTIRHRIPRPTPLMASP